jgi:hypothetical protein
MLKKNTSIKGSDSGTPSSRKKSNRNKIAPEPDNKKGGDDIFDEN